MRVEEARSLADNANQLKITIGVELSKIYEDIKANALSGLYAVHIHRGYFK